MEKHLRLWTLLLLITVVSAQNTSVSVSCGSSHLVITVPVDLFGTGVVVNANELFLGSSCTVTAVHPKMLLLEYPLFACEATRQGEVSLQAGKWNDEPCSILYLSGTLPCKEKGANAGRVVYRNVLHYVPSAADGVIRASPFSQDINCFYPRSWNVSSHGLKPTWDPFSSTVMDRQSLAFALEVYDSSWSQPIPNPAFYLGELINIQASVRKDNHIPLRIYVDECVARPSAESSVKYEIITNHGCLVDGQHSASHFLAMREDGFLRFQLDTFTFIGASNNQIYLICHLKAVSVGSANQLNKACSYDRTTATWISHEGVDCSCCASRTGCGRRRKRRQQQGKGTFREANLKLGPIELKVEEENPLLSIVTSHAAAESKTHYAAGPPPNHLANIIMREGVKEDVSGPRLPFSTATVVIIVTCSFVVLVSILGCYCSNKLSHRGYRMETVLGESGAVAMAPALVGSSGAGSSGQASGVSKKADGVVATC